MLAENFERAAELVDVPQDFLMQVYELQGNPQAALRERLAISIGDLSAGCRDAEDKSARFFLSFPSRLWILDKAGIVENGGGSLFGAERNGWWHGAREEEQRRRTATTAQKEALSCSMNRLRIKAAAEPSQAYNTR